MKADFYFDIVCPYAYMASLRVDSCFDEVSWKPILLIPGRSMTDWPEVRQRRIEEDLIREARRHGLELSKPPDHPRRSVYAMRVVLAAADVRGAAARFFRAYWQEHLRVQDKEVCRQLASELGVDPACVDDDHPLKAATAAATERGVFGVPTVVTERGMFWGADRLHLAAGKAAEGFGVPSGRVRFFHDFASPFSYLASTQIASVAADVEWVPILLGALFKGIGTPMVPLHAFAKAKQDYLLKDLQDWSEHWGVPLNFSSRFPVRTVLALRVSILEPRAIHPLYRATWVEDRDIGEPDVVREVLREAGLDSDVVDRQREARDVLFQNTQEAQRRGVCGVPTYETSGALIWGQDRLWTLKEFL